MGARPSAIQPTSTSPRACPRSCGPASRSCSRRSPTSCWSRRAPRTKSTQARHGTSGCARRWWSPSRTRRDLRRDDVGVRGVRPARSTRDDLEFALELAREPRCRSTTPASTRPRGAAARARVPRDGRAPPSTARSTWTRPCRESPTSPFPISPTAAWSTCSTSYEHDPARRLRVGDHASSRSSTGCSRASPRAPGPHPIAVAMRTGELQIVRRSPTLSARNGLRRTLPRGRPRLAGARRGRGADARARQDARRRSRWRRSPTASSRRA